MNSNDDNIATWIFVSKVQYWLVLLTSLLSVVVLSRAIFIVFRIRKSHYFHFIFSIVVADLSMLAIIITELVSQTLFPLMKGPFLCKVMHFSSNVAATFVNWTWVLMFVQRCAIVFFPLKRVNNGLFGIVQSSKKLLAISLAFSAITQSWSLILITERQISAGENGYHVICERDDTMLNETGYKWVAVSEAVCTYVLPFLFTISTDLAVLVWHHHSSRFTLVTAEGVTKQNNHSEVNGFKIQSTKSIESTVRRRQRAIRRCLSLATVQVALNAPHYILQVLDEIYGLSYSEQYAKTYFYLDAVLYLLYLCQFPMVIVYIWLLDKETRRNKKMPVSIAHSTSFIPCSSPLQSEYGRSIVRTQSHTLRNNRTSLLRKINEV